MNLPRILLLAGLLLARGMFAAGGVTHALATADEIILTVQGSGAVQIVELAPYETISHAGQAPRVASAMLAAETRVAFPRFAAGRDRIYSGFLAQPAGPGREPAALGGIFFVDEIRGVSKSDEPFPVVASKKGLQVQMVDDAIALGVKHAALNFNVAAMFDLARGTNNYVWRMDGQDYYFHRRMIDSVPVKKLTDAGATVTLILLAYQSRNPLIDRLVLHPRAVTNAPNHIAAFNTSTPDGLRYFKAGMEFLADHYLRPDRKYGRAVNFIVGNEVNAHWFWYNLGPAAMETVAEDYLRTVRVVHTAVRKSSSTARVYLSLDHHWNIVYTGNPQRACTGQALVDEMNRRSKLGGDFDWHIAFHPYPENLFKPRVWLDRTATNSVNSPRITFKNLEQLTRYLRQPELLCQGVPRRVILSEQGFHSDASPQGEELQAAAYCYASWKTDHLDGIDSFILHRHVDHKMEGGLNLGLWTRQTNSIATPLAKKKIYEVFKAADTPGRNQAFAFALPLIGITNWSQVLPGK
jgi:hypothetical protein